MPIISLEGENGTWKTGLACSGLLPGVCFELDTGFSRAVYGAMYPKLFSKVDIEERPFPFDNPNIAEQVKFWTRKSNALTAILLPEPVQMTTEMSGARQTMTILLTLISAALEDPGIPNVILDTATLARNIAADAHLEDLQDENRRKGELLRKQLIQIEYGRANDRIRDVFINAKAMDSKHGKVFWAIHHMKDEYTEYVDSKGEKQSKQTGRRLVDSIPRMYEKVDVALRMTKGQEPDPYDPRLPKRTVVVGEFLKCGYNLDFESQRLVNPTWDSLATKLNETIYDPRAKFQLRGSLE